MKLYYHIETGKTNVLPPESTVNQKLGYNAYNSMTYAPATSYQKSNNSTEYSPVLNPNNLAEQSYSEERNLSCVLAYSTNSNPSTYVKHQCSELISGYMSELDFGNMHGATFSLHPEYNTPVFIDGYLEENVGDLQDINLNSFTGGMINNNGEKIDRSVILYTKTCSI